MADELNPTERLRWDAFAESAEDLGQAVSDGDDEGADAAIAAMLQRSGQLDPQAFLNALHVPEDAGEYEPQLRRMLARIPDGWGRWVSCDAGWYPLLVSLDAELRKIFPSYEIHQMKEKFGSLRFYWEPNERIHAPGDPYPEPYDRALEGEERAVVRERWLDETDAWYERHERWSQTPEGQRAEADLNARRERAEALVRAAENASATICEICGAAGELCATPAASPWYKTLCAEHMAEQGYMPSREWKAWWVQEKPRFQARMRRSFIERHGGESALVVCADEQLRVSLPQATYIHDADAARAAALDTSWSHVFVGSDAVGAAFMAGLRERYAEHEVAEDERHAEAKRQAEASGERFWAFMRKSPADAPRIYGLPANDQQRGSEAAEQIQEARQALGLSCWTSQPEHFAGPVAEDEDEDGSDA